jgi:DNA-binding PadR family transcriptional regulator
MESLPRVTPATVDVLRVLLAAKSTVWGLQIVKTTRRPSGSVYPILDRLESLGWVASTWEDDEARQGPRRRYYRLEEDARDLAAHAIEVLEHKHEKATITRVRSAGLTEA